MIVCLRRFTTLTDIRRISAGLIPGLMLLLSIAVTSAVDAETGSLDDKQIESAIQHGCHFEGSFEHYKGIGNHHDIIGPLWLTKGNKGTRGVILTPYLRVYLYGRGQGCKYATLEEARELAGPEIWVALWNVRGSNKTMRPTSVRLRAKGKWHEADSKRTSSRWLRNWYPDNWADKKSLVAMLPHIDPTGALHVEYKITKDGQSYLTESDILVLTLIEKKWWEAANGR